MPHPDEGLIHAWLDGELDAAEASRVEALVANDAEWAAAAAEARGLIAASSRVLGTLDRVPANVIPKKAPARPASRRWVWRAAAVLALMAGSGVVLQRETPELPAPKATVAPMPVKPATPAPATLDSPARVIAAPKARQHLPVSANAPVAKKNGDEQKTALADSKATEPTPVQPARDKDAVPMAAAARSSPAAATAPQPMAQGKFTRVPASCFEERAPRDSSAHIVIRISAAELADSIRLKTLVQRGDTLAAVNGPLIEIRVPCPEP